MRQPTKKPGKSLITSAFIFSIFANILMLTGPLFMLQVYDRVLASRSEETLIALFALVAALYTFYWLLEHARGRVMARYGARLQDGMNAPIFAAVLERAALHKGTAKGTLQDLEHLRSFYGSPVLLALFDLPWTPIFLAAIFIFDPLLGWLAMGGGAVLVIVAVLNQLLTRKKTQSVQEAGRSAALIAQQAQQGSQLAWAQGMGRTLGKRWLLQQRTTIDASLAANDWTGSFTSFAKAFRLFLQSAILALGAWLVLRSDLSPGAMIAASILLGRALAPIELVISQWPVVQRARRARRDLSSLLESIPPQKAPMSLPVPAAHLAIKDVSLVLRRGEEPVLRNVTMEIKPGEAIGVIGKSGVGKSTLARLIVGLVPPTAGTVRLGGATLDQYGPERLGTHIGYLPQDIHVFDGTVAENIAQMEADPDPAKVVGAAQKARIHDIVLRLPKGYDTQIAQTDGQLSGGQKQRLALARALYKDPVLLVLDEPNSALDSEGSEALNEAVARMKAADKAVVIMTHRPTAISSCDRLVVLDAGRVIASGPRDQIVKASMKNAKGVQRAIKTEVPS